MMAFSFLAVKRQNRENHRQLSIQLLTNAEEKVLTKQLEDWEKDS